MKYQISDKKLQKFVNRVFEMILGDLVVVSTSESPDEYMVSTSEEYEKSLGHLGKYWWADFSFNPTTKEVKISRRIFDDIKDVYSVPTYILRPSLIYYFKQKLPKYVEELSYFDGVYTLNLVDEMELIYKVT
jgi:hypothetical protein